MSLGESDPNFGAPDAGDISTSGMTIYICHLAHDHPQVYSENVADYLASRDIGCKSLEFGSDGYRPELQRVLDEKPLAILGFNSELDHSWVASGEFLASAERARVPVIQWILDHPSIRWSEFTKSTRDNSRYLLNTPFSLDYFDRYCLPGAAAACMGGVGPNRRSGVSPSAFDHFVDRPIACMIPLNLSRVCGGPLDVRHKIMALGPRLSEAVDAAIARSKFDLQGRLEPHLTASLDEHGVSAPNEVFNHCFSLLEAMVQIRRRQAVFAVARTFPVLIQSDNTAIPDLVGGVADWAVHVSMQSTLTGMPDCRAVLSLSPLNDMVHDRTMNALQAGCVAIVEDNPVHRAIFTHGRDALLFRYGDDSLREALDLVCNGRHRAQEIAERGFARRHDPRLGFGQFHNIVELARA